MEALITLVLLAVLLAAPCFVQLVLWTAYQAPRFIMGVSGTENRVTAP
jgi:hypothetical protein